MKITTIILIILAVLFLPKILNSLKGNKKAGQANPIKALD
jgi:hypothetical protein